MGVPRNCECGLVIASMHKALDFQRTTLKVYVPDVSSSTALKQ